MLSLQRYYRSCSENGRSAADDVHCRRFHTRSYANVQRHNPVSETESGCMMWWMEKRCSWLQSQGWGIFMYRPNVGPTHFTEWRLLSYFFSFTRWHMPPSPSMSHIVESCPLTKLNGGLSRLHSVDEDAVLWLTSYGSWHAYEKKKMWHI